jgi:hypothetical protein
MKAQRFVLVLLCIGLVSLGTLAALPSVPTVNSTLATPLRHPFVGRDIVTSNVSAAELREFLAGPASPLHFLSASTPKQLKQPGGKGTVLATLAVSREMDLRTEADLAQGMVIAKIMVDQSVLAYGLTAGTNYLWVDQKGGPGQP